MATFQRKFDIKNFQKMSYLVTLTFIYRLVLTFEIQNTQLVTKRYENIRLNQITLTIGGSITVQLFLQFYKFWLNCITTTYKYHHYFFKNGPSPASFPFSFAFPNNFTIFTTNKCEKCPSILWCRDSNPRPSEKSLLPQPLDQGFRPKPWFPCWSDLV